MNAKLEPTRWLDRLLDEARSFGSEMFPPQDKVGENEVLLGVTPLELRPLYSYSKYCEREMKQSKLELEYASSEEEKSDLMGRYSDMSARYRTAQLIFWSCLNEATLRWPSTLTLGLRKDWQVVEYECNHDAPPEIIRRMFGM